MAFEQTFNGSAWKQSMQTDAPFEKGISYIIRKNPDNSSIIEAINGTTGMIDYGGINNKGGINGTNASAVIQSTIDALTSGGTIYLKELELPEVTYGNEILIIEDYQGRRKVYSKQGKTTNIPLLASDPSTSGWGEAQKGWTWFNTTEGKYKYWTGVAVVTYPVTGGSGAPTDASYVTINAEAGLDAEVLHGSGITDPLQIHAPLDVSYIIFKSGSTYYARACGAGLSNYNGTDAATVIQSAINALGADGAGVICVKKGEYDLQTSLTIGKKTILQGEGCQNTIFKVATNINAITISSNDTIGCWQINNLQIDMDSKNGHAIYTLHASDSGGRGRYKISNVIIENVASGYAGMYLTNIFNLLIENIRIRTAGTGIDLRQATYSIDFGNSQLNSIRIGLLGANAIGFSATKGASGQAGNLLTVNDLEVLGGSNSETKGIYINGDTKLTFVGGTLEGCATTIHLVDSGHNNFYLNFASSIAETGKTIHISGDSIENKFFGGWIACGDSNGYSIYDESNANNGKNWGIGVYFGTGQRYYGDRFKFRNCQLWRSGVSDPARRSEKWITETGTGSEQNIAHGLGEIPSVVLVSDLDSGAGVYQSNSPTSAYIYITAANGKKYTVFVSVTD